MQSNLWGWISFLVGFIVFSTLYIGISEIYDVLVGINLLSDEEDYPIFSKLALFALSYSMGYWIGEMVYYKRITIRFGDEENLSMRVFIVGCLIFIVFNLLKEMALKRYYDSTLVATVSLLLDVFAAFGIWWSLTQYWKNLLARRNISF